MRRVVKEQRVALRKALEACKKVCERDWARRQARSRVVSGWLVVSASDGRCKLTFRTDARVERAEPGDDADFTFDPRALMALLDEDSASPKLELRGGKLWAGAGSCVPVSDVSSCRPDPLRTDEVGVASARFVTALSAALPASLDDVSKSFAGVVAVGRGPDGGCRAVATDGARLHVAAFDSDSFPESEFYLPMYPLKTLADVAKITRTPEPRVLLSEECVTFDFGCAELAIEKTILDSYPAIDRVVPKKHVAAASFSTAAFVKALRKVSKFSPKRSKRFDVRWSGTEFYLSAESDEQGSTRAILVTDDSAADVESAYQWPYVLDALSAAKLYGDDVRLEFMDSRLDPVVVRSGDFFAVVMPIRP